jgi:hypothetical protein|nr:MAG TPA: zinc-finger protein [Caudoviricetes sp.]
MEITLIIILAAIVLDVVLAVNANVAAVAKGYDGSLYGILCFLTGPLGLILVAALPDLTAQAQQKLLLQEQKKTNRILIAVANGTPVPEFPIVEAVPHSDASSPEEETKASDDGGESWPWTCKHCGHVNNETDMLCAQCGKHK